MRPLAEQTILITGASTPHPQARDAAARRRLRDLSDQLCGLATATEGRAQHNE